MRIPHSHTDRHGADVKMTPMIDVVFLLLIFFVCTASFQIAESILPAGLVALGGSTADVEFDPEPDLERVIVKITYREGRVGWLVNERPYDSLADVRSVLSAVAQIDAGLPVIIDVEPPVPLGHVIDAYDVCRLVGFDKIQFAASDRV